MYNCPVKLFIFGKYEKTRFLVDSFWRGSPWKISEFVQRAFGEFSRNSPDFCGERRVERLSKNFWRVKMSASERAISSFQLPLRTRASCWETLQVHKICGFIYKENFKKEDTLKSKWHVERGGFPKSRAVPSLRVLK